MQSGECGFHVLLTLWVLKTVSLMLLIHLNICSTLKIKREGGFTQGSAFYYSYGRKHQQIYEDFTILDI